MSHADTNTGRLLVFQSDPQHKPGLLESLKSIGEVRVETSMADALKALDEEQFQVFISLSPEFPVGEGQATHHQLSTALDVISQGVALIDPQGSLAWCNASLKKFPEEVLTRIRERCCDVKDKTDEHKKKRRARSLSLVIDGERYYDATITPMHDQEHTEKLLVVVVTEVTRARRLQQKMDAIDKAGRELVRVDADQLAKMDVPKRLELLERKLIRSTREVLNFSNFAIRLLNEQSGKLELVLSAGLSTEGEQIDIYASTENNGISGYVAATGRSYICPDIERDPRYLVGIDNAHSSLTVPLWLHDKVIGIFNIESDTPAAFSEEDRQFAEIFGRYVAIALHILDLLVVERHATTGRLADNVSSEISGPLGDILSDASTLMEDYIGHDDLRHRLQSIVDNVVRVKDLVREVTQPEDGILGSKPQQPVTDPDLIGKSVLVVDDEEIIRQTVRDVLTKFGCQVETASDGSKALAMLRQRTYDLVLSDIRMPGNSGYDIFAAAKNRDENCPVIFMTGFGYDPHHSVIRARQEGLAAVLYKPFKVDQLLSDVKAAVTTRPEASE
jgi:CheY-like chemotaxis protein